MSLVEQLLAEINGGKTKYSEVLNALNAGLQTKKTFVKTGKSYCELKSPYTDVIAGDIAKVYHLGVKQNKDGSTVEKKPRTSNNGKKSPRK